MEPALPKNDDQVRPTQTPTEFRKLTINAIITHEKLMAWIKERNPIIAQARKEGQHR